MNHEQKANVLVRESRAYRNGKLLHDVLPKLEGQAIDHVTVIGVIKPFFAHVEKHLSPDVFDDLSARFFEAWYRSAWMRVEQNPHMHRADQSGVINQANADALLVVFVNDACMPLDLAMYASDFTS